MDPSIRDTSNAYQDARRTFRPPVAGNAGAFYGLVSASFQTAQSHHHANRRSVRQFHPLILPRRGVAPRRRVSACHRPSIPQAAGALPDVDDVRAGSSPAYRSDCNLPKASTALATCRSVGVLPAGLAATSSTPNLGGSEQFPFPAPSERVGPQGRTGADDRDLRLDAVQFPLLPSGASSFIATFGDLDQAVEKRLRPKLPDYPHVLLVERLTVVFVSVVAGIAGVPRPSNHLSRPDAVDRRGGQCGRRVPPGSPRSSLGERPRSCTCPVPGTQSRHELQPMPRVQLGPVGFLGDRSVQEVVVLLGEAPWESTQERS